MLGSMPGPPITPTATNRVESTSASNQRQARRKRTQRLDLWLDAALKQTFPASDPIASPPHTALSDFAPDAETDDFSD
jgi:hypothetical protein